MMLHSPSCSHGRRRRSWSAPPGARSAASAISAGCAILPWHWAMLGRERRFAPPSRVGARILQPWFESTWAGRWSNSKKQEPSSASRARAAGLQVRLPRFHFHVIDQSRPAEAGGSENPDLRLCILYRLQIVGLPDGEILGAKSCLHEVLHSGLFDSLELRGAGFDLPSRRFQGGE